MKVMEELMQVTIDLHRNNTLVQLVYTRRLLMGSLETLGGQQQHQKYPPTFLQAIEPMNASLTSLCITTPLAMCAHLLYT